MQSTIREHRDGGNAGGIFNRYNVIRVSFKDSGSLDINNYQFLIKEFQPVKVVRASPHIALLDVKLAM